jgi:predicted acyltransferase
MTQSNRLLSIDVLRGLTIAFMIIVNSPGSWEFVYGPLQHAEWNGCTPTDLVFPFFVFIVGLSMAQSFKNIDTANKGDLVMKAFKRMLIITSIGLALNWFPFYSKNISNLRLFGVLQRIALAYFLAALICIFIKEKWQLFVTFLILILYYILLIAGVDKGPLDLMTNLVRKIDLALVGENHVYHGYTFEGNKIAFDPEGLLSVLGSIGNVMLGYVLANHIKKIEGYGSKIKAAFLYGVVLIVLGITWHYIGFPINKPIWSSSYALFTSGLCSILFAVTIYIIDEKKWVNWAFPLKVFGMNALVSFALSGLIIRIFGMIKIEEKGLYEILYDNFTSPVFGPYLGSFISALMFCCFIWLFAYVLYKRNIFVKV